MNSFQRRKFRNRFKVKKSNIEHRLCVFRSNSHIYAQVIDGNGNVAVSSSTMLKSLNVEKTWNEKAATVVGKDIAAKAIKSKIKKVVFDRGGYLYFGRVKCLVEAAREEGLVI